MSTALRYRLTIATDNRRRKHLSITFADKLAALAAKERILASSTGDLFRVGVGRLDLDEVEIEVNPGDDKLAVAVVDCLAPVLPGSVVDALTIARTHPDTKIWIWCDDVEEVAQLLDGRCEFCPSTTHDLVEFIDGAGRLVHP